MHHKVYFCALMGMLMLGVAGCGGSPVRDPARTTATCTDGPKSRYGNPPSYKVFGKTYRVMASACGYKEEGIASWYGPNFHGKRTSSGETYDMNKISAAHKTLPIPSWVKVTNLDNGRTLEMRVNDRGPFHKGRIIDLSKAAAKKLDVIRMGTARVKVEAIGKAEPQTLENEPQTKDYRNRLYLQMGSFSEYNNAMNLIEKLRSQGFSDSRIQSMTQEQTTVHRVQIGPFSSPSSARRSQERVTELGYSGHRVITD